MNPTSPDATAPDWPAMVAFYNQINHYGRANGMALTVPAPGQAVYEMTIGPDHLSSPRTAHGGALAGLMDAALGAAALSLAFVSQDLVSTVEFKMNYLQAVHLHDVLRAEARVEHSGQRLLVSSCVVYRIGVDGAAAEAVARGMGTFNRYPAGKRELT